MPREPTTTAYQPPEGVRFVEVPNNGARTWAQIKADEKRFRAALEKIAGGHSDDPQLDAIRALNNAR